MTARLALDEHGCDEERLRGFLAGHRGPGGNRLALHRPVQHVVAGDRAAGGPHVVGHEALGRSREAERERVVLRDAQRQSGPAATAREVPDEVTVALGVAERERRALGLEVVEGASHQPAQGAARGLLAPERRRQLEHEAEFPFRAPLVLAEVADQVADDEEVDRAEQVDAAEHGAVEVDRPSRDDEARVERREQHRDGERRGEPPADADAQDHEDVEREERARPALREERDETHPDDVDRRGEEADALRGDVGATHQEEEERAVRDVRPEHDVGEIRLERRLLRVDGDHRERVDGQQQPAERENSDLYTESLDDRRSLSRCDPCSYQSSPACPR